MTDLRLSDAMPNGAKVSDWLGTAMTSARISANIVKGVREGDASAVVGNRRATTPEECLRLALAEAEQAADELRAVLRHFGEAPEAGERVSIVRLDSEYHVFTDTQAANEFYLHWRDFRYAELNAECPVDHSAAADVRELYGIVVREA